jgi:hypothetical protein
MLSANLAQISPQFLLFLFTHPGFCLMTKLHYATINLNKINFVVYLDENGFSGPLPPTLGNINALLDCRLYSNKFQGNIPTTLGNLINLSR